MTFHEEERVWLLQCWLHARKPCAMCGEWQEVDVFGGYACQPCAECEAQQRKHYRHRAHW